MTSKRAPAWKPGQSGNPRGRPKGRIDRRTAWRAELGDALPAIIARLVDAARAGDVQAAGLILSRVAPPLRAAREAIAVPGLGEAETLSERARAILDAVAAGTLPSDAAAELVQALAATARIVETDELAARVAALESDRES